MSSSKKEPIILTKENSNNQIIEITAYHLQDLSAVEKAPNLCKLNLIGGELKNFQSLEKCSKLQALNLRLTKVEDFSSLQKIKSIRYLEVVGMQKELIETISKMSELKSLTLKHCCLSSLRGLRNLGNLSELFIEDMGKDPGILEIFSIPSIERLKLFVPREYEHAAGLGIDILVCIGQLSEHMATGASEQCSKTQVFYFETKDDFFEQAVFRLNLLLN